MIEFFLYLFFHYLDLITIDIFNLHNYFSGTTRISYSILTFGGGLILSITNIIIGLVFITFGIKINSFININKDYLKNKEYLIPFSVIGGILYPIFCILYGILGGKIKRKILLYIILSNLTIYTVLSIFILKINS